MMAKIQIETQDGDKIELGTVHEVGAVVMRIMTSGTGVEIFMDREFAQKFFKEAYEHVRALPSKIVVPGLKLVPPS